MTAVGAARPRALDELLEHAAREALGAAARDPLRFVWVSGWEMDGSRLTAVILAGEARVPSLVAKVGVGPGRAVVLRERDNLERLAQAGSGPLARSVPRVLAALDEGPVSLVLLSPLRGAPAALPRTEAEVRTLLALSVDWLLAFHRAMPCVGGRSFAEEVSRIARGYLRTFEPGAAERSFVEQVERRADAFVGQDIPMPAEHGDFCLANLFSGPAGLEVLDWEDPLGSALPGADLVHFLASLRDDLARAGRRGVVPLAVARPGRRVAAAFLGEDPLPRLARAALVRLWDGLGVPRAARPLMFTAAWLKYAQGKAENLRARASLGASSGHGPQAWGLVELGGRGCLDVAELAAREGELEFG